MIKPLLYFSYGMTKCGSTLAFELTRTAMEKSGYPQPIIPQVGPDKRINFVQHLEKKDVDILLDAASKLDGPLILKTHTLPDPEVIKLFENGTAIGHAVYRDPREMALSLMDHGEKARAKGKPAFSEIKTIDDAVFAIQNQSKTLSKWLQLPNVLPLFYTDIAFDQMRSLAKIMTQIGIKGHMQEIIREVRLHRFTQLNKGVRRRHLTEMQNKDQKTIRKTFKPIFKNLIQNRVNLQQMPGPVLPLNFSLTNQNQTQVGT